jgi:hypothetical protein
VLGAGPWTFGEGAARGCRIAGVPGEVRAIHIGFTRTWKIPNTGAGIARNTFTASHVVAGKCGLRGTFVATTCGALGATAAGPVLSARVAIARGRLGALADGCIAGGAIVG